MDIDTFGKLAALLNKPPDLTSIAIRQGTVQVINSDNTVDITLGASQQVIPHVHRLNDYGPVAQDTIWVLVNDSDLLVIGSSNHIAWRSYTPTFATVEGTGTPLLGNGGIQGSYYRVGNTLHIRGTLILGSSTNLGVGRLLIYLPPAFQIAGNSSDNPLINGYAFDSSAGLTGSYPLVGRARGGNGGGTDLNKGFIFTYNGQEVSGSTAWPFLWTTSDFISWQGAVEIIDV